MLAAAGGSLPVKQNLPLRWTDTVTFRLGYETDLSDFNVLRFGYDYEPNPSPNSTFNPYLGGGPKHVFSLGFSHKLRRASAPSSTRPTSTRSAPPDTSASARWSAASSTAAPISPTRTTRR